MSLLSDLNGLTNKYMIMRLSAPMMSFGQAGRRTHRLTFQYPSKSAIIGIIGSAIGMDRNDEEYIKRLASLKITVFALKLGERQTDFHTIGCGTDNPDMKPITSEAELKRSRNGGKGRHKQVTSNKDYLSDADFIVVCEGDSNLIDECSNALKHPYRPLFLGRKEFMPSRPIFDSVYDLEEEVICRVGTIAKDLLSKRDNLSLPFISDVDSVKDSEDFLMDVPIRFGQASGGFHRRMVRYGQMPIKP